MKLLGLLSRIQLVHCAGANCVGLHLGYFGWGSPPCYLGEGWGAVYIGVWLYPSLDARNHHNQASWTSHLALKNPHLCFSLSFTIVNWKVSISVGGGGERCSNLIQRNDASIEKSHWNRIDVYLRFWYPPPPSTFILKPIPLVRKALDDLPETVALLTQTGHFPCAVLSTYGVNVLGKRRNTGVWRTS